MRRHHEDIALLISGACFLAVAAALALAMLMPVIEAIISWIR